MRKTSVTLIIIITLWAIVAFATIGLTILSDASKAITTEVEAKLENFALVKTTELQTHLDNIESAVNRIASLTQTYLYDAKVTEITSVLSEDEFSQILELNLNYTFKDLSSVYDTFIITNPDVITSTIASSHKRNNEGYFMVTNSDALIKNISVQSDNNNWFYLPILRQKGFWSDPVFDAKINESVITYAEPIFLKDQVIAVIGAKMHFSDFKNFVSDIDIYEHGYAFLLNKNHDNLVHPIFDSDTNMRTLDDGLFIPISNKINSSTHGIQYYEFYGEEKIMAYAHLDNGWILCLTPSIADIKMSLVPIQNHFYSLLLLGIILFITIGFFALKILFKAIKKDGSINMHEQKHMMSMKKLQEKNEKLMAVLSTQSQDLDDIRRALNSSNEALEGAQHTIVELREQRMVIDLVQHITSKLSNPIATSMTAASYLIEKNNVPGQDNILPRQKDIYNSAKLISNNQEYMKNILDNLKQLTIGLNLERPRHFPIKAQVHHTISNELSVFAARDIKLSIDGDEQLMVYLPIDMFSKLMSDLIHHSIRVARAFSTNDLYIKLYKDEQFAHIIYEDLIPWQNGIDERIFNPYYQDEFSKDGCGLELYIIKHTVMKIFLGTIDTFKTENDRLAFHIRLPIH